MALYCTNCNHPEKSPAIDSKDCKGYIGVCANCAFPNMLDVENDQLIVLEDSTILCLPQQTLGRIVIAMKYIITKQKHSINQ